MSKVTLFFILSLSLSFTSQAQNFVWNKVYGGKSNDYHSDICRAGSGQFIYTLGSVSSGKPKDSVATLLGNIALSSSGPHFVYLAKMDTSGRVIWAKKLLESPSSAQGNIISDVHDNIYAYFDGSNDSMRVVPNTPAILPRTAVIVKFDKNGNFIWQRTFPGVHLISRIISQGELLTVLVRLSPQSGYIIGPNVLSNTETALVLMDTNNSIRYAKPIGTIIRPGLGYRGRFFVLDAVVQDDSVYLIASGTDSVMLGPTVHGFPRVNSQYASKVRLTYALATGEFVRLDELLVKTGHLVSISESRSLQYFSPTTWCLLGSFIDTLELKGFNKVTRSGNNLSEILFYALYKNNRPYRLVTFELQKNWFGVPTSANVNDGFLYLSVYIRGDVKIDGFDTYESEGRNMFMKVDSLGNVMWVVRTGDTNPNTTYLTYGFAFDKAHSVYLGTTFSDTMRMDNKLFPSMNGSSDYLITKIRDYSITRGPVYAGPYCAGDTIRIPYTGDGKFNTNNEFVAELSDEYGNFDGGHRELGRISTHRDSVIWGLLPLFDVATSAAYRIRILSTSPRVQSYYRLDSLRLLIYSKDTANAGDDTTICYGSRLLLKTSGGSKWRWSPGNMVADSTSRMTMTEPITLPVRFRIIISDSSGCGKTDTAYKWVYPAQKLVTLNRDTTVCRGKAFIQAQGIGGLPGIHPHRYEWLDTQGNLLSTSSVLIYTDTMPSLLQLLLKDVCSVDADTVSIHVRSYDSVKAMLSSNISLCNSIPATVKAKATGGLGTYAFTWYNTDGSVNNTTDSIVVKQYGTFSYGLKVSDNCSAPADSIGTRIMNHSPLSFVLPDDSILCYGSSTSIVPKILNGTKKGPFRFIRKINSVRDTIYAETYTKKYFYSGLIQVSAFNTCDQPVSDSVYYSVLPPLNIQGITDTAVCHEQMFRLKAFTTGGKDPLIRWMNPAGMLIKMATAIDTVFKSSSGIYTFIASDGCTVPNDTALMQLKVMPPLKAILTATPICYKDTVHLKAKLVGGKANQYQFSWKNKHTVIGIDTALVYNTNNTLQTVYFVLSDNCSSPVEDSLELNPMAMARLYVDKPIQCLNKNRFIVSNQSDSGRRNISFDQISFPQEADVTVLPLRSYMVKFKDTGTFRFKAIVRSNADQCVDSATSDVQVKPVPKLNISWERKTLSFDKSRWLFRVQSDQPVMKYTWYIDQFPVQYGKEVEQEFLYSGNIKIRVVADGAFGCSEDTSLMFDLLHRMKFYVPDVITGNNDGINDGFFIPGSEYMQQFRLRIYNRWGECLFDSTDPNEKWLPEFDNNNVYLYRAEIRDIYNEGHKLTGTFHVLR